MSIQASFDFTTSMTLLTASVVVMIVLAAVVHRVVSGPPVSDDTRKEFRREVVAFLVLLALAAALLASTILSWFGARSEAADGVVADIEQEYGVTVTEVHGHEGMLIGPDSSVGVTVHDGQQEKSCVVATDQDTAYSLSC